MNRKHICKAIIAIAVAMVFITPVAAFANFEGIVNMNVSSSDAEDNGLQALDVDIIPEVQSYRDSERERYTVEAPEAPYVLDGPDGEVEYVSSDTETNAMRTSQPSSTAMVEAQTVYNPENAPERTGNDVDWWPQFQHDIANTGYTTGQTPDINKSGIVWKSKFSAGVYFTPPVVDDKVYGYSKTGIGRVSCLNADNGSLIWSTLGARGSPAIDDDKVYGFGSTGCCAGLYCLNATTGEPIWSKGTWSHNGSFASPTIANNRIYAVSHQAYIQCSKTTDGTLIWEYRFGEGTHWMTGSPAVADGNVYFTSGKGGDDTIYCFDAVTGVHVWNVTTDQDLASTILVVADNKVYVASRNSGGCGVRCYNADNGSLLWTFVGLRGSPTAAHGKVYVSSYEDGLYCLNPENGSIIWHTDIADYGMSFPVVAGNKVYCSSTFGIDCFDADTGTWLGTYDVYSEHGHDLWTNPSVADEKMYFGAGNYVCCLGLLNHDAGVVSIDSPVSGPEPGTITPQVTVKNYGNYNETNVLVNLTMTNTVRYFSEDFADEYFWPPLGWTEEEPGDWRQYNSNNAGGTAPEACLRYKYIQGEYAYLQSPAIDTTDTTNLILGFKSCIEDWYGVDYNCTIWIRPDDTQPWTDITPWSNPITDSVGPDTYQINISSYIGTGTQVQFEFKGPRYNIHYWYLDDVYFQEIFTPPEYTETVYVDLLSHETETVNFSDWMPAGLYYIVDANISIPNDEVPWNNHQSKAITFHYYDDLSVLSIDSPVTGFAGVITPEVIVRNDGSFDMTNQSVNMKIFEPEPIFLDEDFSGGVPPTDWTEEEPEEWRYYGGNYAGGEPGEARLRSGYIIGDYAYLQTPPVDTTSVTELTLEFKSYVRDNYGGGYNCTVLIKKDASHLWTDITPWANPITARVGPDTYQIDISSYIGTGTEVRFEFEGDNSYYWYLDDVTILISIEYDETIQIDILEDEIKTVSFPDWTPDYLQYELSGSIDYIVTACTLVEDDEFPDNDWKTKTITLDYIHDVGVDEITKPFSPTEQIYFHTGYDDDAVGLINGGTYEAAIRLTPDELGDYDEWSLTSVKFFHAIFGGGYTHSGNIKIYEEGTSIEPGDLITSEPYTVNGEGWFEVELSNPVILDADEDVWVSVEVTHIPGEYPIGVDAGPAVDGKGDWIYYLGSVWHELQDSGLDYNWCIEAEIKDKRFSPGTYELEAIVSNPGTFDEGNFNVDAKIWFVTETGQRLFYEDDFIVTITMNPGDETMVSFRDVNFKNEDEGDYKLEITTELAGDDIPDNDQAIMLFTIEIPPDTTPPVTTCTLIGTIGENDWYISDVFVILDATDDDSGVDYTEYNLDESGWVPYPGIFPVPDDGPHTLKYYSVDNAGNEEITKQETFKIDQTSPTITLTAVKISFGAYNLIANVSDATSGVAYVEFYVNDELVGTVTTAPYEYEVSDCSQGDTATAIVYDNAGNEAKSPPCDPVSQSHSQSQSSVIQQIEAILKT